MPTFGRQSPLWTSGYPIQVTADGRPEWKSGGITIDWTTVAAITSSDYTIPIEGTVVKVGYKYLRYGQILTKITQQEQQTITVGNTPTFGSFNLTGTRPDTNATATGTVNYNSTVAQTQAVMDSIFGASNTVVSGAGALPGNVQTVTFQGALNGLNVAALTVSANTLNNSGTVTIATSTAYDASYAKFGPYDPTATDGRQNLNRGQAYILNETVLQSGLVPGLPTGATDNPGVFEGGVVFRDRILMAVTGSASLAAGPTETNFLATFPRVLYAQN